MYQAIMASGEEGNLRQGSKPNGRNRMQLAVHDSPAPKADAQSAMQKILPIDLIPALDCGHP